MNAEHPNTSTGNSSLAESPRPPQRGYWRELVGYPKSDVPASIVVFLVALPLCMGIAIASGVPVAAGLITGIVGGLVVGWISGAPLQVSGPAAGLTVIVYEIVQRQGLEILGLAVLAGGFFQLLAGTLRYGRWFRAVSPAVVYGMLAGIGVLIFASQFHVMVDDSPKGDGVENLVSIPEAVAKGLPVTPLGSVEARRARHDMLLAFEAIHEQQTQLAERIAERLPHGEPSSSKADEKTWDLSRLARDQQALREELEALLERMRTMPLAAERMQRATTEARAVLAAMSVSEEALQKPVASDELDELLDQQTRISEAFERLFTSLKSHDWAAKVGILTILVIVLWNGLAPKRIKFIPAPLVAVIAGTIFAAVLSLPVLFVEVPENLWEEVHFPTWTVLRTAPWFGVLQSGLVLAAVASAETLLCASAVDRMQPRIRTNYDRELAAQGVGNMICGLLGALPMTGVIVRSAANVDSGGRSRLSTILHGVWLLLFVSVASAALRMIPTASLAAILVYTGYKLVNWRVIGQLKKYGWGEVAVYLITLGTIVATDLLTGVITGIVCAALKLLFTFSHFEPHLQVESGGKVSRLELRGAATFLRLPILAQVLENIPGDTELHVNFEQLSYIDHACLDLLMNWAKQHEATGGKLVLDWESLHSVMSHNRNNANGRSGRPTA